MQLFRSVLVGGLLATTAIPAVAQEFDTGWIIGTRAEFLDYEFNEADLRINNCQVSEKKQPMLNNAPEIRLTCSARNASQTTVLFSIQVIGMLDLGGGYTFALSAKPSFGRVTGGKTETVSASNLISEGAVDAASVYVFRIVGQFADR